LLSKFGPTTSETAVFSKNCVSGCLKIDKKNSGRLWGGYVAAQLTEAPILTKLPRPCSMADAPFPAKAFHPSSIAEYFAQNQPPPAEFAAWRAQHRYGLRDNYVELTRSPHEPYHPFWQKLANEDRNARYAFEEDLLGDIYDAVSCVC
jgi:hypothetical protein